MHNFVCRMSTRVLLATLSIPITPERTDIARLLDMDGIIVEKQRRLATLLGLQAPPTRIGLINDMVGISSSILQAQNRRLYGQVLLFVPGGSDGWTSFRTAGISHHSVLLR